MKRLFRLLFVLVFFVVSPVLGEENNPCLHPNTGLCGVPLSPAGQETLYLSVPVPAAGESVSVRSVIRDAIMFGSQTLNCKICGEPISCNISIRSIVDNSGEYIVTGSCTKSGTISLRCENHREYDRYSERVIYYTVKFESTGDEDPEDCDHDWGDWSYGCDVESPSDEFYSTYNSSATGLRTFITETAQERSSDKSKKTKVCRICGKERREKYSHTADWLCGYYSPDGQMQRVEK